MSYKTNDIKIMKVQTTTIDQTANEILGTEAKTLYYLILGEGDNKITINVGKKTHETVKALIAKGETPETQKQMNDTIIKELKK